MARRVLVVDDEPQIRAVLVAYLRQEGYDVVEAATGADAIRLTVEVKPKPDLVLLDIGLPGVDGLDVLRQVRKTSDVYVILVTARADEVDKVIGLGVGADDYVTKPFSPRDRCRCRRSRSTCWWRWPARPAGCSPGPSCWSRSGATTSSAIHAWSTCTSAACARPWATMPPTRA